MYLGYMHAYLIGSVTIFFYKVMHFNLTNAISFSRASQYLVQGGEFTDLRRLVIEPNQYPPSKNLCKRRSKPEVDRTVMDGK